MQTIFFSAQRGGTWMVELKIPHRGWQLHFRNLHKSEPRRDSSCRSSGRIRQSPPIVPPASRRNSRKIAPPRRSPFHISDISWKPTFYWRKRRAHTIRMKFGFSLSGAPRRTIGRFGFGRRWFFRRREYFFYRFAIPCPGLFRFNTLLLIRAGNERVSAILWLIISSRSAAHTANIFKLSSCTP